MGKNRPGLFLFNNFVGDVGAETKTADQIINRICRYCSRISEPSH